MARRGLDQPTSGLSGDVKGMGMKRRMRAVALALAMTTVSVIAVAQATKVVVPPAIEAKIKGLPKAKRDFLLSNDVKSVGGSHEKLFEKFATKTPAEIEAYVDAMISVIEQNKYHAETDMAAIPLDTTSKTFNGWKVKRPQIMNPKREPGPINVDRYMRGRGGIPTFANAPIALTPEDLKAGKVDVAFVGAPLDMGSGYRGAAGGPLALRSMSGISGNDMYSMVNPSTELNIVDYGDIAVDNMSTERSMGHIREMVAEIAATGAIPFIIGGDHSLMYSDAAGLADVYGKGEIGVVHFDAHYDAGRGGPHMISHGQPVYRLIKEGHVPGKNFIQVALRAKSPDADTFQWMREQGFRYHTMVEVEKKGWDYVMKKAVQEAKDGPKKIFISFDVDALDPVYMTGTGTPVPGGLTIREAMPIVRRLCAETNVVGFELVEVAPVLDQSYKTALNSNYILNACLAGIAMRKKGLTQDHYLSPMSSGNGQPD
jgi:agmatinase